MQKLTTGVMRRAKMAGADDSAACYCTQQTAVLHRRVPLGTLLGNSLHHCMGAVCGKYLLHYITFFNVA